MSASSVANTKLQLFSNAQIPGPTLPKAQTTKSINNGIISWTRKACLLSFSVLSLKSRNPKLYHGIKAVFSTQPFSRWTFKTSLCLSKMQWKDHWTSVHSSMVLQHLWNWKYLFAAWRLTLRSPLASAHLTKKHLCLQVWVRRQQPPSHANDLQGSRIYSSPVLAFQDYRQSLVQNAIPCFSLPWSGHQLNQIFFGDQGKSTNIPSPRKHLSFIFISLYTSATAYTPETIYCKQASWQFTIFTHYFKC